MWTDMFDALENMLSQDPKAKVYNLGFVSFLLRALAGTDRNDLTYDKRQARRGVGFRISPCVNNARHTKRKGGSASSSMFSLSVSIHSPTFQCTLHQGSPVSHPPPRLSYLPSSTMEGSSISQHYSSFSSPKDLYCFSSALTLAYPHPSAPPFYRCLSSALFRTAAPLSVTGGQFV